LRTFWLKKAVVNIQLFHLPKEALEVPIGILKKDRSSSVEPLASGWLLSETRRIEQARLIRPVCFGSYLSTTADESFFWGFHSSADSSGFEDSYNK